ncbi:MAG: hypothetical protein ABSB65_15485 [Candidatus Acidiferrales bacterium]|jgi:hypothetical protein
MLVKIPTAIGVWALLLCGAATSAFADAGVILNESLDTSVARITGSGHSAVYLSNICPDGSPVKMRLCRPGEQGSVLSNYTTLGEDQPYEWNIVPLSIYLYGVEDPRDRPLVSSREIKAALEERYREKYLSQLCTGARCRYSSGSEWREMVGATLERSMYIFVVKTSADQDRALIAEFNSLPNVNHFNGAFRNCADFTKRVMNTYFPHSTRRDAVNDFFMTSPKAVARSFTRYAKENPDLDLRVLHFAQVPGTIKRSEECRSGTEQLYHSKKLVVPLGVLAWQAVPAVTASYIITARFNPEHEFEKNPSASAIGADNNLNPATNGLAGGEVVSVQQLAAEEKSTRDEIVGTNDDWKQFRANLDTAEDEAIHAEIIPDRSYLKRVFAKLAEGGEISVDANGALWLSWRDDYAASQNASASSTAVNAGSAGAVEKIVSPDADMSANANAASGAERGPSASNAASAASIDAGANPNAARGAIVRVGLSASNIFARESDAQTAYQIVLARMESELRSPKHSRETALEFREDWARLQQSRAQATAFVVPFIDAPTKAHSAGASATGVVIAASYN